MADPTLGLLCRGLDSPHFSAKQSYMFPGFSERKTSRSIAFVGFAKVWIADCFLRTALFASFPGKRKKITNEFSVRKNNALLHFQEKEEKTTVRFPVHTVTPW